MPVKVRCWFWSPCIHLEIDSSSRLAKRGETALRKRGRRAEDWEPTVLLGCLGPETTLLVQPPKAERRQEARPAATGFFGSVYILIVLLLFEEVLNFIRGLYISKAVGVRNLFEVIQTIRDEQGQECSTNDEEEGEEEEKFEDDDAVDAPSDYESAEEESSKPDASEGPSSAEPKMSKGGKASEDDGGGVGSVPLEVLKFRRRSKSSLASLPSTLVLGKTPANVETPASYKDAVSAEKEAELARLLMEIDLQESAAGIDADPHKSLLVMMGTPERATKASEGPIVESIVAPNPASHPKLHTQL